MYNNFLAQKKNHLNDQQVFLQKKMTIWTEKYHNRVQPQLLDRYNQRINTFITKVLCHLFRSSKTQMNFKNSNLLILKSKNKSTYKNKFLTCLERATKPLSSEMPLILAVFLDRLKESKESKTKFYSKKCMVTQAWLIAVSPLSLNTTQAWGISSEAETKRRKSILRWDTQIKLPTVFWCLERRKAWLKIGKTCI